MRSAAELHLAAIALALIGAIVEGSLEPPSPPFPSYERLALQPGERTEHPRRSEALVQRGELATPPGASGPIPVTCWTSRGQLVELALRGDSPVHPLELAEALDWYLDDASAERAPPLGPWPAGTPLDLDYVWAEIGLLYDLRSLSELRLIALTVLGEHLDEDHRAALGVEDRNAEVPLLVLRLREAASAKLQLAWLSPDGRWICRREVLDFAGCLLSVKDDDASSAHARWGLAPPATAAGGAR